MTIISLLITTLRSKKFICFILFIISLETNGQNLIIDGGFERISGKVFATFIPNQNSIRIGNGSQFDENDAKLFGPLEGKKSAGCFTTRNDNNDERQSLMLNLKSPLEQGKWYEVSFYMKHGFGLYATNNNGIAFGFKEKIKNAKLPPKSIIVINKQMANSIIDNQNWQKYTFIYHAVGAENILLVGNVFYSDSSRKELLENPNDRYKGNLSLYLFDKINVSAFNNEISIYFESENHQLNKADSLTLNSFLEHVDNSSVKKILIQGYADNSGDSVKNKTLALFRAESVKYYLINRSINEASIDIENIGTSEQFSKDNLYLNRCVRITLIH